ncbi:MAG: hypothetical protein WBA41_12170 [Rivularia sp. (in: cyanobacteria)]
MSPIATLNKYTFLPDLPFEITVNKLVLDNGNCFTFNGLIRLKCITVAPSFSHSFPSVDKQPSTSSDANTGLSNHTFSTISLLLINEMFTP